MRASRREVLSENRLRYGDSWEIEAARGDLARLSLANEPDALLRFEKPTTSDACRVLFRLDYLGPHERGLIARTSGHLASTGASATLALVEESTGRQLLIPEKVSSSPDGEFEVVIEGIVPTGANAPCFVALELGPAPALVRLHRLTLQFFTVGEAMRLSNTPRWAIPTLFDASWYVRQLVTPLPPGASLLAHYLNEGERAGLSPHPLFDPAWYKAHLPEPLRPGETALEHYIRVGAPNGLSPHPLFDASWYAQLLSAQEQLMAQERSNSDDA